MDETLEVGAVRKRRRYTQSERRTLSERRIMDAALKLIARQGSSRTTLAEIGAVAGYTHGLVSHRFGSKGALVRVVMRHLQAHFAKRTAPDVEHLTGLEALKVLMRSYLSGPGPDSVGQRAFHVLIGEALGPVPDIRADIAEADQRFRHSLEKRLEEGIQAGELRRDLDPA